MLSIRSSADMARALSSTLLPDIKRLLALRRDQLLDGSDDDLGAFFNAVVIEPGDTAQAIETALGWPLTTAPFEWIIDHGTWLESVIITDDDGFALALFVPVRPTTDDRLITLLRQHA